LYPSPRPIECDENKGRFEAKLGKIAKARVSKPDQL
jgi:hypothetical protein